MNYRIRVSKQARTLDLVVAEHIERGSAAGWIGTDQHALIRDAIRAGTMPPQHTRVGGEICIHGRAVDGGAAAPAKDWARGQELYDRVAVGMSVSINP